MNHSIHVPPLKHRAPDNSVSARSEISFREYMQCLADKLGMKLAASDSWDKMRSLGIIAR